MAAALVIGTGGSAGREAPVVAMGGVLGGWIGKRLGLSPRRREILIGCGTGAAIAAAYDAPLAGLFFALEVVLGDYTSLTLSPVVLASVAGTAVCRSLEGVGASHFAVPPYRLGSWWEIAAYAGLGLAAGVVAPLFVVTDRGLHRWFARSPIPPVLRPAVGGLGVGALALLLPQVMGNGYEHVGAALAGGLPLALMAALVLGKVVATGLTLGSGGWGGDFAPLLFIGAMLGGAYGEVLARLLPGAGIVSPPYALVGMGAVLAAAVRCPITAILLLFELTGSYQVILPIMTACAVASPVARAAQRRGMYHEQLAEMGGPAAEAPETRLLETVRVAQVMRPGGVTLDAAAPYREILRVIANSDQLVFPVLGEGGRVLGALTFRDLRRFLDAAELEDLVVAADVASEEIPVLTARDTLARAMELFSRYDLEELPVVEEAASRRFAGIVTRREVMAARARLLAEWEMEEG
ncbi:MAG: chloride channel protein [Nitrospirae bacterium]|nr:MAG: chloride channel protein [Nitrospirota bacterium]